MTYLETAEHYAGEWLAWRLEQNLVANGYHGAVCIRPEPPMPDMALPGPPRLMHVADMGRDP